MPHKHKLPSRRVVIGYTQRPGAVDEETKWDMVLYALDAQADPVWTARFGGDGVEFGRSIAGPANHLWALGHTSSGRNGSSVFVIRMDASNLLQSAKR